ncbi:murein biosynthesis integral membrane protein MurJ [Anaerosalibacter bizertensis]|uniref:murein biosynthesis integral membrane protein MurJ n=1 Tax=Anaerosalibacter bizertensis TaxID=932217 RepID=UPI001C0EEB76|nr:murein biosynthesis integral membrane protein MurJ [Anaerosalibacter bizertensis]MBU5294093.1 murein biosynthesis integral membrane protein MurJ [Anaerosalibacter bizertensis]
MKKTAILLMLITIVSKIFGFARDITLSYFYGTSNISDAYLISLTIPMVIFSFIGTAITTGYIPLFNELEQKYGEKESNKFTNNLVNLLLILCTIIVILGLIFTEQIVKIFASGFEGETLALAVQFTKISILGIYFTGMLSIFGGFLRIKGNYTIPALVGFPMNFFIILSIFLSSKTNILVLSIGSVIAIASQLILLIPFIYKEGYRYNFVLEVKDDNIKKMLYLVLPVVIGVSANQINTLVDKTIASSVSVGGISALNYSFRLIGFVQGLFVTTISTVMYPMISKMAVEDNIKGLKKTVAESINSISILVIPATIGAMCFAEPVVKLLFGRGAFDAEAISLTSNALFFYSIGMIGFGLREILSRAFYSLQDTKTPMINGTLGVTVNIVLNIILSKFMGIGGLALSTSISAIFCTVLLFISFRKKIGSFGMKNIAISFIKVSCASLVMGVIAKLLYNILIKNIGANLALIAAIIIGALVYFVMIYFMKIDEVDSVIEAMKKKVKKSVENQ